MARTFSLPYSICVLTNPVVYLLLFVVLLAPQLRGQTTSSWNDGTGHWSKATDWTPNGAPNNGGGTFYNVVINGPGRTQSHSIPAARS